MQTKLLNFKFSYYFLLLSIDKLFVRKMAHFLKREKFVNIPKLNSKLIVMSPNLVTSKLVLNL